MTLTTHAVTGALLGAVSAHNIPLAALSGFMSHFILDAIPHWDYHLTSADFNKTNPLESTIHINTAFFKDLIKIGLDGGLGLALTVILFMYAPVFIFVGALAGACAALLPDFLQFIYFRYRREPFVTLQKFHVVFMHARSDLKERPFRGIIIQVVLIVGMSLLSVQYLQYIKGL